MRVPEEPSPPLDGADKCHSIQPAASARLLVSSVVQELCIMDERSVEMAGKDPGAAWAGLGGFLQLLLVGTAALIRSWHSGGLEK